MNQLLSHFANDLVSAIKPVPDGAVQPSVQGLLRQTAYKLAQNEFQEWSKLLMSRQPAPVDAAKTRNFGLGKKAVFAAVGIGIGYYLIKRH